MKGRVGFSKPRYCMCMQPKRGSFRKQKHGEEGGARDVAGG